MMRFASDMYTRSKMQFDTNMENLRAVGFIGLSILHNIFNYHPLVQAATFIHRLVSGGKTGGIGAWGTAGGNALVNDAMFWRALNDMTDDLLDMQSSPPPPGQGKAKVGYRNDRWERWRD
jgi:hypothetical protein